MLDLEEGRWHVPILGAAEAQELLRRAHRIAIVGASPDPSRPSHGVMRYLLAYGYDCVPVNPRTPDVLGVRAFPSLEAAVAETGRFDIVNVFRRPRATPDVARSAVSTRARALWLQVGIVNWEAARIAQDGGLAVVMDRCTRIDHATAVGEAPGVPGV